MFQWHRGLTKAATIEAVENGFASGFIVGSRD